MEVGFFHWRPYVHAILLDHKHTNSLTLATALLSWACMNLANPTPYSPRPFTLHKAGQAMMYLCTCINSISIQLSDNVIHTLHLRSLNYLWSTYLCLSSGENLLQSTESQSMLVACTCNTRETVAAVFLWLPLTSLAIAPAMLLACCTPESETKTHCKGRDVGVPQRITFFSTCG